MKKLLEELLDSMDRISVNFEEVTDTCVREKMGEAIVRSYIKPEANYDLPDDYGMFSPKGNKQVKAALSKFIQAAKVDAEKLGLSTPQARLVSFQDIDVHSRAGNTYDAYFGHTETV